MRHRKILYSLVVFTSLTASFAFADHRNCDSPSRGPRTDFRQHESHHRYQSPSQWYQNRSTSFGGRDFQNGVRSGELSWREVRDLQEKKNRMRQEEAAYWSDGRLSRGEREDLQKDYQNYQKDLNHELNDGEHQERSRFGYGNRGW